MEETNDQLSFREIADKIWSGRVTIALLVLISAIVVAGTALIQAGFGNPDIACYLALKGIEGGRYPGGATFSPNDLKTPEVLRAATDALNLDPALIPQIASRLLVEYDSPATAGIISKYRQRLAAAGLSAAEIDTLNEEFKDELTRTNQSSLRLEINAGVADLGASKASRLLLEVPAQWSRIYSERYRIFEAPGLESVSATVTSLGEPASTIAALRSLEVTASGLKTMISDNRIRHLVDPAGRSPSELYRELDLFRTTRFRPLSEAMLSQPDAVAESYRQNLQLQTESINDHIASYDVMVQEIASGREGSTAEWTRTRDPASSSQLQLAGDSLETIIELVERASSAGFLREVMMERHELKKQLAEAELELARSRLSNDLDPSPEAISAVAQRLGELLGDYEGLRASVLEKLRADIGNLYSVTGAPFRVRDIGLGTLVERLLGVVLIAFVIGVLLALLFSRQAKSSTSR